MAARGKRNTSTLPSIEEAIMPLQDVVFMLQIVLP
jgi:hypothetical protein